MPNWFIGVEIKLEADTYEEAENLIQEALKGAYLEEEDVEFKYGFEHGEEQ